jgi:adenosylhomocysteine nucleosidase
MITPSAPLRGQVQSGARRRARPFSVRAGLPFLCALMLAAPVRAAELFDPVPRTAVISAFAPELTALAAATQDKHAYEAGGAAFITGTLEGRPVVLFLSGMSMVNAAMTTQRALDRFLVRRIVFSGVAGGVDPGLDVGDVVAPAQWRQYLESVMARQIAPGVFQPPADEPVDGAPFGMIFPMAVQVARVPGVVEPKTWFAVDPDLLAIARVSSAGVTLKRCAGTLCLKATPKVVLGGNGVSGQSFVDNAALRTWAFSAFGARVLDMETAAVAQVAYVNNTPFIAFRSLSDLAGGEPGQNQASVFFQLASDNSAAVVRAFLRALPN